MKNTHIGIIVALVVLVGAAGYMFLQDNEPVQAPTVSEQTKTVDTPQQKNNPAPTPIASEQSPKSETMPESPAEFKFSIRPVIATPPRTGPLATAIEVSLIPNDLESLTVQQQDDKGNNIKSVKLSINKGDSPFKAWIVPQLLGNVDFAVFGRFKDGSLTRQDFSMIVTQPISEPLEFRADPNFSAIVLSAGDTYKFYPTARYAVTGMDAPASEVKVLLYGHVTYRFMPARDESIVRLEEGDTITALRPGTTEIEARFGSSRDVVGIEVGKNE